MNKMNYNTKVVLLSHSGLGVAEVAARTAYQSFDSSEHSIVRDIPIVLENPDSESFGTSMRALHTLPDSELLYDLAWVYHHESVLEHVSLQYQLTFNRGILQELSRSRIGVSPTVKSTRYTMYDIINAYIASEYNQTVGSKEWFKQKVKSFNMFSVVGLLEDLEINSVYDKLYAYDCMDGTSVRNDCLSKEAKAYINMSKAVSSEQIFKTLGLMKKKRNAGDKIKFIVTDMWLTEGIYTFNLRALKHFLSLRDSGAAWAPIQTLAQEIINVTPEKYLRLIHKKFKNKTNRKE